MLFLSIFANEAIIAAISLGVAGLITWLFTMLQAWLNSKIKDAELREALSAVTEVIQKVVLSIQQTFVDQLKKDGKFDRENQKKALEMALEKAKCLITNETKKIIEKHFGTFEDWLEVQVEATIQSIFKVKK